MPVAAGINLVTWMDADEFIVTTFDDSGGCIVPRIYRDHTGGHIGSPNVEQTVILITYIGS